MYSSSRDMECDRQNSLSFWTFFAFLPPNNPKNQNFERNEKETMEMLPLYTSVPQIRIIRCMVPEIWSPTDRTFLSF